MATTKPAPTATVLEASLDAAHRDLRELAQAVSTGMIDVSTALALAMTTGIEHARRLMEASRGV